MGDVDCLTRTSQNDTAHILVDNVKRSDASSLRITVAEMIESFTLRPIPHAAQWSDKA